MFRMPYQKAWILRGLKPGFGCGECLMVLIGALGRRGSMNNVGMWLLLG